MEEIGVKGDEEIETNTVKSDLSREYEKWKTAYSVDMQMINRADGLIVGNLLEVAAYYCIIYRLPKKDSFYRRIINAWNQSKTCLKPH